jgi:outer membrane protein insertion porin family
LSSLILFLILLLNKTYYVREIKLEGLKSLAPSSVYEILPFKAGENVDEEKIRSAIKNLYSKGYFYDISVYYEEESNSLIFRFKEKPRVAEIEIKGAKKVKEKDVKEKIKIKIGDFIDYSAIATDISTISEFYKEKGFPFADVSYEVKEIREGRAKVVYRIEEGDKLFVRKIYINGNKNISDEEIKKYLETKEKGFFSFITSSGRFDAEKLSTDADRIRAVYLENGYAEVKVSEPEFFITPDRKSIVVIFSVEEGEKYYIGNVDVDGDLLFEKEDLLSKLKTKSGELFKASNIRSDILYLTSLYSDYGYAFANVDPKTFVSQKERRIDITFTIEKGKIVYVDRINIKGNTKTRDKVIRREMRISEGDLYSESAVKFSQRRIYGLGFFDEVKINQDIKGEDRIDLNVEIKEGRTGSFSAGVGFSSVENFIATAQASIGNFLGYGQTVRFSFELGSRRQLYSLSFYDPYFLDTNWGFGAEVFNFEYRYVDFRKHSTGGELRLGYLIGEFTRFFWTYRYEYADITSIYGEKGFTIEKGSTSSITLSLIRDTRNHPFDPSTGTVTTGSVEFAGGPFGGDYDFTKFSISHRRFYNPWWKFVFTFGGRLSFGFENHLRRLPYSERYFIGGIDTVRGYRYYGIGPERPALLNPLDPSSSTVSIHSGGNKMIIFNAELLFPLIEEAGIKWVFFFDAGQAYKEEEWMNLSKIKMGWGFGIRWFTPIAPFRFEWGFPINPAPGEDRMVFEFTIGTFF